MKESHKHLLIDSLRDRKSCILGRESVRTRRVGIKPQAESL